MEQKLSSERVYSGKIFDIDRDKVLLPSGRESTREVLRHPGACGILPVLPNGDIVLIQQYRYAIGQEVLEIPAGKIDPGEDIAACALRELMEEIGMGGKLTPMGKIYPSCGCMDEVIHLFVATDLYDHKLPQDFDENITLFPHSPAEIKGKIASGELTDAKTVCAVLRYFSGI